ncbi:MAG: hypothetical protein CVU48_07535 [Candidatus Cloacimonetes bacterium HGW-Cloacimonetes-1]|jgi:hypothetical protein|nr:MAG: hypothetical protein CVU48_07535 [Candidatus Cloacimonetes bacterium HGW-Cloacimonetes-1]
MKYFKLLLLSTFILVPLLLNAAVGCDLNDPDKDVKRLFPESTGYKAVYKSIKQVGGETLLHKIETRLGDKFQGLYETMDVPYTVYIIYQDKTPVGYIHGVNQKGKYGGIQVFLSLDNNLKIKNLYFQKMSTRQGEKLKSPAFTNQFKGLTLSDMAEYDVKTGKVNGKPGDIKSPAAAVDADFVSIIRAVKKNLILMDEFF